MNRKYANAGPAIQEEKRRLAATIAEMNAQYDEHRLALEGMRCVLHVVCCVFLWGNAKALPHCCFADLSPDHQQPAHTHIHTHIHSHSQEHTNAKTDIILLLEDEKNEAEAEGLALPEDVEEEEERPQGAGRGFCAVM